MAEVMGVVVVVGVVMAKSNGGGDGAGRDDGG